MKKLIKTAILVTLIAMLTFFAGYQSGKPEIWIYIAVLYGTVVMAGIFIVSWLTFSFSNKNGGSILSISSIVCSYLLYLSYVLYGHRNFIFLASVFLIVGIVVGSSYAKKSNFPIRYAIYVLLIQFIVISAPILIAMKT